VLGDDFLGPVQLPRCAEQVEGIGRVEEEARAALIGLLVPAGLVQVHLSSHLGRFLSHSMAMLIALKPRVVKTYYFGHN
jgi:hypothetical protein